ncbi:hypothetical protein [Hymenobacter sp. BRD67]|uniref:hypothetical protein n=1 Tax=Hymenobacter sp. BRD67 TaxID=2675877 RepID=UPI0015677782|nr:hypothetical protein [Hymenobacter sp. BRD67]QKG55068.1 hypothetical protein GKZ67_21840 [Hymenobacter sp. BRD67]
MPERWWRQVPANLLDFAAAQLALDGAAFTVYGQREATVYEHCQAVLLHWAGAAARRARTRALVAGASLGTRPGTRIAGAGLPTCANSSWCAPPWSNSSA